MHGCLPNIGEGGAELAADMARFCVRHNGAKSTLQYTCVPVVPLPLFLRQIWPSHARHSGPLVKTPGQRGYVAKIEDRRINEFCLF